MYCYVSCDPGVAFELNDYYTFDVPGAKWHPAFKSKAWDGKKKLFSLLTSQIYVGLIPSLKTFCEQRGYDLVYEDQPVSFSLSDAKAFIDTLNLPAEKTPRDYQLGAFIRAINDRRTLFLSPTASGKSLIIYLIMRYYLSSIENGRVLIIVPSTGLVRQLASDFWEYGLSAKIPIHMIADGSEKYVDAPIVISTWQAIYKLKKDFFNRFDVIMGDEAHNFQAKSLTSIMEKATDVVYRYGFTGTLNGAKIHHLTLEGLFGRIRKVTTTAKLMDQQHLSELEIKAIVLKHPEDVRKLLSQKKNREYQKELDYIITSENRNKFLSNLVLSLKGNTLVLFQYKEKQGEVLYKMISEAAEEGRKVYYVSGDVDTDDREAVRKAVEAEENSIVVASVVFATGVNIVNLHNVVFASPSKSRIRILQSIGRVLRRSETATKATLYDVGDDITWKSYENHTMRHFKERIKTYAEEKFKYRIYPVELK